MPSTYLYDELKLVSIFPKIELFIYHGHVKMWYLY